MAKSRTERITALTSKIDTWDTQIDEITRRRDDAVAEIGNLLGLTTAPATKSVTKHYRTERKLGDRILDLLREDNGIMSRETIATRLKEAGQKVSLSLYHLTQQGAVYKTDDGFVISASAAAKSSPTDDNANH